jgi:hypothetical protein
MWAQNELCIVPYSLSLSPKWVEPTKHQMCLGHVGVCYWTILAIIWGGHHLDLLIHHPFNLLSHLQETWVVSSMIHSTYHHIYKKHGLFHPWSTQLIITFTRNMGTMWKFENSKVKFFHLWRRFSSIYTLHMVLSCF